MPVYEKLDNDVLEESDINYILSLIENVPKQEFDIPVINDNPKSLFKKIQYWCRRIYINCLYSEPESGDIEESFFI